MSVTLQIWVEACHNPAFRCGGWAFVRRDGETLAGMAGGERSVSADRAALMTLAAALKDLPAGAAVEILSSDGALHGAWRRLAALRAGGDPPAEDLDLWARLRTATEGRSAKVTPAARTPGGPTAFAKAWADQAYEKTKARGPFSAAIPKVNLAKAGA